MNNMRKFFAMILAIVMVMSLATTAFADDGNGYTITINGTAGHTYEVYQIFTGDLSGNVLSNIVWGNGVSAAGQTALGTAATVAEGITDAKAFAASIDQYLTNPQSMTANETTYTLSGLEAGYYLIKDEDNTQDGESGTYTAYMLKVVKDVTATPKDSVPTVDKSVTKQDQNADDFEIGDEVTFILKATLGDNLDEYKTYKVVFHDTMSEGLTYKEITSVTVDDETITSGYTAEHENGVLTVTIDDVIALGAEDGSDIVVTYTATLNEKAEIGQPGNPNEVYLEYSNDPNWDVNGDGQPDNPDEPNEPTGETPKDTVVVFTFELDVTKIDGATADAENPTKLQGAEFVLLNIDKTKVATVVDGKLTGWVDVPAEGEEWPENTTLTSSEEGLFVIAGLDADTYYLRETKAPASYNLLTDPIKVVITAQLNTAEDKGALEALTIAVNDGDATPGVVSTGIVTTTVKNNAGTTLPETGGMGTTLFYILGGVLVLAAVVILITKKRIANAK